MACVMEAGRVAVLVLRTLCVLAGTAGWHLTLTAHFLGTAGSTLRALMNCPNLLLTNTL